MLRLRPLPKTLYAMKNKVLNCPNCESAVKPFRLVFKNEHCSNCGLQFYISTENSGFFTVIGFLVGLLIAALSSQRHYQSSFFLLAVFLILYLLFREKFETYEIKKIV